MSEALTQRIRSGDAINSEIVAIGLIVEAVRVVPGKDTDDLDNLIVHARKHLTACVDSRRKVDSNLATNNKGHPKMAHTC